MEQILKNLALIDLTSFCKANGIDCSGSHLQKHPKTWMYSLVSDKSNKTIVTVKFSKNSVPMHFINNN